MTPAEFWSHVDTSGGPLACWPWTGPLSSEGYGTATVDGVRVYSHRYACESQHGALQPGEVARHMCVDRSAARLPPGRDRACCNPFHVDPGSQRQNMVDRIRHGRGKGQRPRPNPDRRLW